MSKRISSIEKAYLAGFLDGDGSIYIRLKPNSTYRYGFQVAPYIVFFQSQKSEENFKKICSLVNLGYLRRRNDGILEYIIGKQEAILKFLEMIKPYVILKEKQVVLMIEIIDKKKSIKNQADFSKLTQLVDRFRELNYSKKRKR